jgi:hypothetical protein
VKESIIMRIQLYVLMSVACLFFGVSLHAQKTKGPNHLIKFDAAPIFVGEFMPYYEYIFNSKISAEIGVGFVTENYLMDFVQETNYAQSRIQKKGPAFSLSARYYPYRKGDLIYCSAAIKYRRYREAYEQYSIDGDIEEEIEFNQRIIPRIGLGYHYYFDQHFLLDLSANLGLAFEKEFQVVSSTPVSNYFLHFGLGFKFVYVL